MIKIEDFWKVDDLIKEKWGRKYFNYISYCGLNPVRPLERYDYFCTPKNTQTFATTGGNGVHFGIVDNSGPIVMTVPMASENNAVVATDLEEFFSIGYHVGWFGLEELVYDFEATITYFNEPDNDLDVEELRFLKLMRDQLKLSHFPLTAERLSHLKNQYFESLDIGGLEDD